MDNLPPPPPYTVNDPNQRLPEPWRSKPTGASSLIQPDDTEIKEFAHISGTAYFAMRPLTFPSPENILCYQMRIPPLATWETISFPQPEQNLLKRDVDYQDWNAFLKHLLPDFATCGEGPRNTAQFSEFEDPEIHFSYEPKPTSRIARESASRRMAIAKSVTAEWNEGFFEPRGLRILLDIEPNHRLPIGVSVEKQGDLNSQWLNPQLSPQSKEHIKAKNDYIAKTRKEKGLALYIAISKREIALVQLLLEAGADVNAKPSCAVPMLTKSVKSEDMKIVTMLLSKAPDLEATAPAAETALYAAVSKGNLELVNLLLIHGAKIISSQPAGGLPPLYRAAKKGHLEIVRALLVHGAPVDESPPGGSTALYEASKSCDLALMQILLEHNASVDKTPPAGPTAFRYAVSKSHQAVAELLLRYGANVEAKPPGGNAALYCAVSNGDLEMMRLLLDNGASVDRKSCGGESPLVYATRKGKVEFVKLLLMYEKKREE